MENIGSFWLWWQQHISRKLERGGFWCLLGGVFLFRKEMLSRSCPVQILAAHQSRAFVVGFFLFCFLMCQMCSVGERSGLQADQFNIWTLLLRRHAVVMGCSMWLLKHERCFLESCVPLKPLYTPTPCTLIQPQTIRDAAELSTDKKLDGPSAL